MKYILMVIKSIIFPLSLSVKVNQPTQPKLCINCKHFIPDCNTGKYGRCLLFPTKEHAVNFLVNGVIDKDEYYFCSTSRSSSDMCGIEGKMYENEEEKEKNENTISNEETTY
jgi:hypothetical protein